MRIGCTTSFPVEVILAAGHTPVDLNNIFITGTADRYVEQAEHDGYPRSICAWIKGLYSVAKQEKLDQVIGIVQGDCSNTHSLLATLQEEKIEVVHFSFPYQRSQQELDQEIARLEALYGVTRSQTEAMRLRLWSIRNKLCTLDQLTWNTGQVSGLENHIWLVSSSDFNGDPDRFEAELDTFLAEASNRPPRKINLRLGYLGVPPIITDLYDRIREMGAEVIFNEVQRQFSMPFAVNSITEQYLQFTYPYSVHGRVSDIKEQSQIRQLDGLLSYTQAFCHRQIDNIILRKHLPLPMLTLEGDQPGKMDARTQLRLESFIEIHSS